MRAAQEQALATTPEAVSHDGGVRVVVDATGVVTTVEFARTVFEPNTPEKLARTVAATVQAAAGRARAQLAQAWVPVREEDSALLASVGESAASQWSQDAAPAEPAPPAAAAAGATEPAEDAADERPW